MFDVGASVRARKALFRGIFEAKTVTVPGRPA